MEYNFDKKETTGTVVSTGSIWKPVSHLRPYTFAGRSCATPTIVGNFPWSSVDGEMGKPVYTRRLDLTITTLLALAVVTVTW